MTRIRGGFRGLLAAFDAGKADPLDANRPRKRIYGARPPRIVTPKREREIREREARNCLVDGRSPF